MSDALLIAKRYRLEEKIGEGAMGDVYRGVDTETDRAIAVKALKPIIIRNNQDLVDRFKREGEALRQLNHPNIVSMLEMVEENGGYYLIMDYVEGGTLRDLIDRYTQLPIRRALSVALDLSDALTRAHRLGIVHRDLKPANVLIAKDGTPRLTDFGVAHMGDDLEITKEGAIIGTYGYLSPEACMGVPLDDRSDIWSFGVLLYEMLTGKRPFSGGSPGSIITSILNQPLPDASEERKDLPEALHELLYRMLTKDRDMRVPSIRMVGAELEAIIKGDGSTPLGGTTPLPVDTGAYQRPRNKQLPTPTPTLTQHNHLPKLTSPFIGREIEVIALTTLLGDEDCRLITLLGPGGMGKTRLALEVAERQADRYIHGVHFISLAPLHSPDDIIPEIAETLGFQFSEHSEPSEQLMNFLREKQMMLVFDNFEHVLGGVRVVADVLDSAAGVVAVVTSRTRLNLSAECVYEVKGMALPEDDDPERFVKAEAVQLFVTYARRVQLDYKLEFEQFDAVRRICTLTSGMPLGIELAAAWVRTLSPDEIADELAEDIDFLANERDDVPERQRSMRAVFNYSWELLSEEEQGVLSDLSIFRGGFTREGAKVVASAKVHTLAGLVDKSLLHRDHSGRYAVHELIRQFALQKLEENEDRLRKAHEAHTGFYKDYVNAQGKNLVGKGQLDAMQAIEREFDNIRSAWIWAVENRDYEAVKALVYNMHRYVMMRGRFHEARDVFQQAVEQLEKYDDPGGREVLGLILTRYSVIVARLANYEEAKGLLERSLELATERGDKIDIAFGKQELGNVLASLGDLQAGHAAVEESITLFEELKDRGSVARGYYRLGFILAGMGKVDEAVEVTQKCMEISEAIGDTYRLAGAMANLGSWNLFYPRWDEAVKYRKQSLELWRDLNNSSMVAHGLAILGGILTLTTGDPNQARPLAQEGLELSTDTESRAAVMYILSWLDSFDEKYDSALEKGKEARELAERSGNFASIMHSNNCVGYALFGMGQGDEAEPYFKAALTIAAQLRSPTFVTLCLPPMMFMAVHSGKFKEAASYLGLAYNHPATPSEWMKRFPLIEKTEARIKEALGEDGYDSARSQGPSLDLMALPEAFL